MPRIIDYDVVEQTMREHGFVSLYHNSGAFGFGPSAQVRSIGWIGPEDASIRPSARQWIRQAPPPFEHNLAAAMIKIRASVTGPAWLMPKSHWHYELHFGNGELLEGVLGEMDIEPAILRYRNNGSAIEFGAGESPLLGKAVEHLLSGLAGSDFLLAFPEASTLCTIHHHKQLWWQTADATIAQMVDSAWI